MPSSTRERSPRAAVVWRGVEALVALVIALAPLVVNIQADGRGRFAWRMFSVVDAELSYEIRVGDGWTDATLDRLGWWDERRHVEDENLGALCDIEPNAVAARRLVDGTIDDQIRC